MKVVVLGANGMLGRAVCRCISSYDISVIGVVRSVSRTDLGRSLGAERYVACGDLNVDFDGLWSVLRIESPDIVINVTGVKPTVSAANQYRVNSLLPRLLAERTSAGDFRLVHFSTDAVFDGTRGLYTEFDMPNPQDAYAISKYIGEPRGDGCTVIRTSMIGRHSPDGRALVDWFLAQTGKVSGYSRVVFSGLTVNEIAKVLVGRLVPALARMGGLWNLAAAPITKHELLCLIRDTWGRKDLQIEEDASQISDHSLDGTRLNSCLGYVAPEWRTMLQEMREECDWDRD